MNHYYFIKRLVRVVYEDNDGELQRPGFHADGEAKFPCG